MGDFMMFRKMITPYIIRAIFVLGMVLIVVWSLGNLMGFMMQGDTTLLYSALTTLILGPLILRVYCEVMILLFSMHETMLDIRQELRSKGG